MQTKTKKHVLWSFGALIALLVGFYSLQTNFFVWSQNASLSTAEKQALSHLSQKYAVTSISSLNQNTLLGERKAPAFQASVLFSGQEIKAPPSEKQAQVLLETKKGDIMLVKTGAPEKTAAMMADYRELPFLKAVESDASGSIFSDETANPPSTELNQPVSATLSVNSALHSTSEVLSEVPAEPTPVTVAVLDSGLDMSHPAFLDRKNLWRNEAELNGIRGVDDDHNGFVDDIYGWDFTNNTPYLTDQNGHGTHVAGIIAAEPTEYSAMTGVNPNGAKLMVLRVAGADGSLHLSDVIAALNYADQQKVSVVNMSFGFENGSEIFADTLKKLQDDGIFLIAAAGNKNNSTPMYPAAYSGVFSVGATNPEGGKWLTSNFGAWVKTAVPGKIFSTLPDQQYGIKTGTSQSAALVTGLYSYYKSQDPEKTSDNITQEIGDYATQFDNGLSSGFEHAAAGEGWESLAIRLLEASRAPSPSEMTDFMLQRNITIAEAEKILRAYAKNSDLTDLFELMNAAHLPETVSPDLLLNGQYTPAAALRTGDGINLLLKVRNILNPAAPRINIPSAQLLDKQPLSRQKFLTLALQLL